MAENGRVLVVDGLISEDPRHSLLALTTDLAMLVITGGCERTEPNMGSSSPLPASD
jgi:O-methyltransferase domain